MSPFTHLHVSSAFSAHRGASWPDEIAAAAHADGATAAACTDRDGLYGAVRHITACLEHGLDPIVGVDLAVLVDPEEEAISAAQPPAPHAGDGSHEVPGHDGAVPRPGGRKPRRGSAGVAGRVVVLAHGNNGGAGWRALCRLVSDAHAHTSGTPGSPVPVGVLRSELASRCLDPETGRPVLTVLIGHDSDVGRAMRGRRFLRPRTLFREWLDAMPVGALAVELVTHLSPPGQELSTSHAVRMLRLATEHAVPAVLTNAVRHVNQDGAATADAPDAREASPEPAGQAWFKPAGLMQQLGRDIIHAAGMGSRDLTNLLSNTERIADRCRLDPATDAGWKRPVVPEASVLGISGEPQHELAERVRAGIARRFPALAGGEADAVEARLDHELDVIGSLGVASCFLAVAEVAAAIRGMGVRSAVRGRGASSLVNYLLGISHVDPLRHGLVVEPFLSRGRTALPEIGIDVESAEWHTVYRRIVERFGAERVACLGLPRGHRPDQADADQQPRLLAEPAEQPDTLPHALSQHPRGVILGDASLRDRTPVQPSGAGLAVSQFDREDTGLLGMLSVEVFGSRVQGSLAFAVREVARIHGSKAAVADAGHQAPGEGPHDDAASPRPSDVGPAWIAEDGTIDLDALPADDSPTLEVIRSGPTLGCLPTEPPGAGAGRDLGAEAAADAAVLAVGTYQSAWLEAHHPESFLAGIFEHHPGPYPSRLLVAEARRLGIPVLPVDVNASRGACRVERIGSGPDAGRLGVRLTLKGVGGLSRSELARLVAGQPYASVAEVRDRARLAPATIRRLAEAGAFDSLHRAAEGKGSAAELVAHLAELAPRSSARGAEPIEGQLRLDIGDVPPARGRVTVA